VKLKISVEGRSYEVEVEVAEADHAVLPPSYPVGSALLSGQVASSAPVDTAAPHAVADEAKVCRSPVSGIVVKVLAQVGQTLQVGDSLLVLEAMKMETEICAPVSGKVVSMNLKPGDNVQAGVVVVEFE